MNRNSIENRDFKKDWKHKTGIQSFLLHTKGKRCQALLGNITPKEPGTFCLFFKLHYSTRINTPCMAEVVLAASMSNVDGGSLISKMRVPLPATVSVVEEE